jgi:hypothetical protein
MAHQQFTTRFQIVHWAHMKTGSALGFGMLTGGLTTVLGGGALAKHKMEAEATMSSMREEVGRAIFCSCRRHFFPLSFRFYL